MLPCHHNNGLLFLLTISGQLEHGDNFLHGSGTEVLDSELADILSFLL